MKSLECEKEQAKIEQNRLFERKRACMLCVCVNEHKRQQAESNGKP